MVQINESSRAAAIEFVSAEAGVAEDAITALNLPDATLKDYSERLINAVGTESLAGKLTPAFGLAAIGAGCAAGFQPLTWQIFSSSSYPEWMFGTLGCVTVFSALAAFVVSCSMNAVSEERGRIGKDLRNRISQRVDELAVIKASRALAPQPSV